MDIEDVEVNIKDLEIKARSKKELYNLLQVEGNVYLPPIGQAHHDFIADIISGAKKVSFTNLTYYSI
jgi:hypothetical protein